MVLRTSISVVLSFLFLGVLGSSSNAQSFEQEDRMKSPLAAFTISAASTAIPFYIGYQTFESNNQVLGSSIITAALVLGPSLGYLYSNDPKSLRKGVLNRSIALAPIAYGSFVHFHNERYLSRHGEEFYTEEEITDATVAILIGTAYLGYNVVADWFGSARSAKRYNRGFNMRVSPGYHFESGSPTLNLRIDF